MRGVGGFICVVLVWASTAAAQSPVAPTPPRKQARAARVANDSIRVDGRLDDEAWQRATPVTDFIQKEPIEGTAPTDPMEVRFVYDDHSLYVGARMTSRDGAIQAPLGRRDNTDQTEYIMIAFDTFLDRRTSAVFGVTAAGVRLDRYHSSDAQDTFDTGFDPVWRAETHIDGNEWTAELSIPFSQLRFSTQAAQLWGLNILRSRPTLDEEDYWILIPRTVRAWSSRFGDLEGIADLRPPRRIEAMPYVSGASTIRDNRDIGNPFDDGKNLVGRIGADLKMGLGPNLTLDAAIHPDFGQVEADPAEVNLTAFETRFNEKRPFFLEGAQLFNIGHPNFYYSRRIGMRPTAPATDDYVEYPTSQTILAAAKLTGRLRSKTSLAFLTAVTGDETAELASKGLPGLTREVPVAAQAFHAVGRVLQEFGANASTAGVLFNYLHRDLEPNDPLAALYSRDAFALAGNTLLRFKGGEYEFKAAGGSSLVAGDEMAIERIQRSSAHYAQRPDRTYSKLDPTLTALGGYSVQLNFDRVSGRHWLWGANSKLDSENFETNDYAQLNGADGILSNANLRYRETRPGKVFRNYSLNTDVNTDTTLRGLMQAGHLRSTLALTWSNFWTTNVALQRDFETNSVSLTRGGPLMGRGPGWTATASVGNRATSETRLTASTTITRNDDGASLNRVTGSLSVRPAPRWQFTLTPLFDRITEPQQYVSTLAGGRPETYNNRYVFAFIDRSTLSMQFRLGLTIKPDMNLDVYAEPFAASGRYYDYGELRAPGSRDRLEYGTEGTSLVLQPGGTQVVTAGDSTFSLRNRDFNTLSFRSNVVLRWEWRAGSTLYVVWQQDRSEAEVNAGYIDIRDTFRSITAPGSNIFVIKTSVWLPLK